MADLPFDSVNAEALSAAGSAHHEYEQTALERREPNSGQSCRESNPQLYQAKCLLPWRFVTSRSNSVPLVTCGFAFVP